MTSLNITCHLLYVYFRLRTANFFYKNLVNIGFRVSMGIRIKITIMVMDSFRISVNYRCGLSATRISVISYDLNADSNL